MLGRPAVRLRYLVDTNILIYLANRRSAAVAARFARLRPGEIAMSCVTYGELRYGAEKSVKRADTLEILERLAERIAAHAIAEELTLVTNNEREFARVAGLKLENWV